MSNYKLSTGTTIHCHNCLKATFLRRNAPSDTVVEVCKRGGWQHKTWKQEFIPCSKMTCKGHQHCFECEFVSSPDITEEQLVQFEQIPHFCPNKEIHLGRWKGKKFYKWLNENFQNFATKDFEGRIRYSAFVLEDYQHL